MELWWTVALVGIWFLGENWINMAQVMGSCCVIETLSYKFGFLERMGISWPADGMLVYQVLA